MSVKKPVVFVSSTFFDLQQVRADLGRFIDRELGYVPLLSEHPSFPIDPDANTVENCRRRVDADADMFVLVIGGRYGSLDRESKKSVTNIEYLAARAKGIPIYAFIQKRVSALLPVWAGNPSADFSAVVQDSRVLAFAKSVKDDDSVWTTEFESAQDIVDCLRQQWAYLFADCLQLRRRVVVQPALTRLGLRGAAFRLAAEQTIGWEYKLFVQSLVDGLESERGCRKLHEKGITLGAGEVVVEDEFREWLLGMMSELQRLMTNLERLFEMANESFGAPGVAGNVADIVEAARGVVGVWKSAITWSTRVKSANVPEQYRSLTKEMSRFSEDAILQLEQCPATMQAQLTDALERVARGENVEMSFVVPIRLANSDAFHAELARVLSEAT